ncbi:RHS repeat-associated core domain-containing protein [Cellulomonas avistercoris]|nr:RHS repeat-associated core domain-containing protein [Cellulomonas avistercoris]
MNDLVASQEVPGVEKAAWTLDPLQRFSTQSTSAWVNEAWASSTEQVIHYDGDGDEPGWIVEDATQPDKVTRWVEGADGQVAVQTSATGDQVLQLVNLHGDVVGTIPIDEDAPHPAWQDLRYTSYDEFGNPEALTGGSASQTPPARYGWLGAAQRSADTPAGVLLMGVRLYHPGIGRFLQVDPVAGGSANAYDYCNADPVNCTDLGGTIAWGRVLGAVAVFGEVASMIPGPVGVAAGGIAATAYLLKGDHKAAAWAAAGAAAALVGAGAAVRVARGIKRANTLVEGGQRVKNTLQKGKFLGYRPSGKFTRAADRQARAAAVGRPCSVCGVKMERSARSVKGKPKNMRQVEQDHIQARSRGGNNSPWNRREICARCNNGKGAK